MLSCAAAFAQKPKVVVGAVGEEPKPGLHKNLEMQIKSAFEKSGKYTVLTREGSVLAQIFKEIKYQESGSVDDGQRREIGKQSGAQYVCAVEISALMDSYTLNAQLVDIESAELRGSGQVLSNLKNAGDFMAASEELVRQLLGGAGPSSSSKSCNYGCGIFLDESAAKSVNPISSELVKIIKRKVNISDGTCVGGVRIAVESDREPACTESMVGVICRANASLVITQCKGNTQSVFPGSQVGSDQSSKDAAIRQLMRKMDSADFWGGWIKELKKWEK
jgi:hypothetical protein